MCLQVTLDFRKGKDHEGWSGRLPEEKSWTDLWKIRFGLTEEDISSRADLREKSLQVEVSLA